MSTRSDKQATAKDLRGAEREPTDRASGVTRISRETRETREESAVAHAMVDALEDILQWERASERALRVAGASSPDVAS